MSAPSRLPMVAGNWKMNTTVEQGVALALAVADRCAAQTGVEVAVLPPFPHLVSVRQALGQQPSCCSARRTCSGRRPARTRARSPRRCWPAGATSCSSGIPSAAISSARRMNRRGASSPPGCGHGFRVIVAVGETDSERDGGATFAVVDRQLDAVLAAVGAHSARALMVDRLRAGVGDRHRPHRDARPGGRGVRAHPRARVPTHRRRFAAGSLRRQRQRRQRARSCSTDRRSTAD